MLVSMNRIARMHTNALMFLVLFISSNTIVDSGGFGHHELEELQVATRITEYRPLTQSGTLDDHYHMRKLGAFQVCLMCRCCLMVSDPTTCSNMPCCFGIDCQLPNKPFGVCAFVPTTCNCTSCGSP